MFDRLNKLVRSDRDHTTAVVSICSFISLIFLVFWRLDKGQSLLSILLLERGFELGWLLERIILFLIVLYYVSLLAQNAIWHDGVKSNFNRFAHCLAVVALCFCAIPFPEVANDGLILSFGAILLLSIVHRYQRESIRILDSSSKVGSYKVLIAGVVLLVISFYFLHFFHNLVIPSQVGFGDANCQIKQSELFLRGYLKIPASDYQQQVYAPGCMLMKNSYVFSRWLPGHGVAMALASLFVANSAIAALIGSLAILTLFLTLFVNGNKLSFSMLASVLFMLSPAAILIFIGAFSQVSMCIALLLWASSVAAIREGKKSFWPGLIIILSLSFGILTRPFSVLGMLILPGGFLLYETLKGGAWEKKALFFNLVAAFLGLSIFAAYNYYLTGSLLLTGYELLYGPSHRPGFHIDPSGTPFTIIDGLRALWLNLATINRQLFGIPIPSFCLVGIGLLYGRFTFFERLLIFSSLGIGLVHVTYWAFLTVQYGPRFIFETLPILIIIGMKGMQHIAQLILPCVKSYPMRSYVFASVTIICLLFSYAYTLEVLHQKYEFRPKWTQN